MNELCRHYSVQYLSTIVTQSTLKRLKCNYRVGVSSISFIFALRKLLQTSDRSTRSIAPVIAAKLRDRLLENIFLFNLSYPVHNNLGG